MTKLGLCMFLVILTGIMNAVVCRNTKPVGQDFWPLSIGQFSQSGNMIMTYFDFNKDRNMDIIAKTTISAQQYINLYLWRPSIQKFTIATSLGMSFEHIIAILPADFDSNGKDDIAVIFDDGFDEEGMRRYGLQILTVECVISLCKLKEGLPIPTQMILFDSIQPFLITLQNEPVIVISKLNILYILVWKEGQMVSEPLQNYLMLNETDSPLYVSGKLKYSYWGDYDGDCLSDLILCVTKNERDFLQFFNGRYQKNLTFTMETHTEFPLNHFSLVDVNFDGKMDIVLLFDAENGIQIHYHKYGKQTQLCTSVSFPYDFQLPQDSRLISKIQRINFGQNLKSFKDSVLRFGDIDNDGYPDLTLTLKQQNSLKTFLFINILCEKTFCGPYNQLFIQKSATMNIRTFARYSYVPANSNQTKFQNIQSLSFFDLFEDGYLDLIANTFTKLPSGDSLYTISALQNYMRTDSFFMKILLLDGRSSISSQNGVIVGGNIQMFVTLLSGHRIPTVGNQFTQVSGRTLQLPYIHLGLGRTNNYAQTLTATLPINNHISKHWSPIVPNSQVIIIPPISNPKWILTTYIEATAKLNIVFWLVVLTLILLGIFIIHETRKQKLEDRENLQSFYSILR